MEEKIQQLLHLVDSKYPAQLDQGLNAQLDAAKQKKGQGSREDVFSFISLTFRGTRHQAVGDTDTTLYLSLQHPHADVRLLALKTVQELLEQDSLEPEVGLQPFPKETDVRPSSKLLAFLKEALLERLSDDSLEVVDTVLRIPSVVQHSDPALLFERLQRIFTRKRASACEAVLC